MPLWMPLVQAPACPARGRLVGRKGQQDPPLRGQCPQVLIVVRYGQPVLFPDSAKAGQFGDDILADLDGGRDQHGTKAGRVIDEQLSSRVTAEDRVLHAVARGRDVEPLAVSGEPVGAQVRAPVAADPGDDDVTRLGQERLDLVGGCHPPTLSGPPRGHRLDGLGVAPMSSVAPRRLTECEQLVQQAPPPVRSACHRRTVDGRKE